MSVRFNTPTSTAAVLFNFPSRDTWLACSVTMFDWALPRATTKGTTEEEATGSIMASFHRKPNGQNHTRLSDASVQA